MLLVSPILQMVALNGVAIRMEAGVEMEVRESLVESALASGCTKVGAPIRAKSKVVEAPKSSNTLDAMALLIEEANPMDFSRDGTPKVRSIERILGYDITAAERDSAWATFQEA
jgi:hypothetical protein